MTTSSGFLEVLVIVFRTGSLHTARILGEEKNLHGGDTSGALEVGEDGVETVRHYGDVGFVVIMMMIETESWE
jgi:hypothetical protein